MEFFEGLDTEVWDLIKSDRENRLQELAKHGDQVCGDNYNNIEFLESQFSMMEHITDEQIKKANGCGFGNMAILACQSPEPYNQKAKDALNKFITVKFGSQYTL